MPHKAPLDPDAPFQSRRPETHEEWQARMGAEVLAVTRSGLYLDFRFLDQALAALEPTADERCRTLATDGQILCYQPSALLRLYRENPRYLNRLYLHSVFHCLFRHLWMQGKRDPVLWHVACDIAVENVLDNLHRKSVERPLTYLRRRAYESIAAEGRVVAAAPAYRWLVTQTPGVQKQLAREFYADDHRLWPKPRTDQPNAPIPLPQKSWQKISERMQTELEMRDKEAGQGAGALAQQVKAANRSRRSYRDFLRRFCVLREEPRLDPDTFDLNFYTYGLSVYGSLTYTRATYEGDIPSFKGRDLPLYSRQVATAGVRYEVDRWTYNLDAFAQSMQRAPGLSTDSQGNFTHNYITEPSADGQYGDIPGYVTWNARVGYDFGPQASNLKLGLGVKNLFDKQYFTRSSDNNSGIYVGQPRTLFMQASVGF